MSSNVTTGQTVEVMVIAPNRDADEVSVPVGTTVAQLAAQLGIPDAAQMSALDEMSVSHGPNTRIGEDATPTALSYVYKLAGAR